MYVDIVYNDLSEQLRSVRKQNRPTIRTILYLDDVL